MPTGSPAPSPALQFALSNASGDSFEIQSIQVSKNVVQQLLLSGLSGQIASAELAISGLQASITQAASATTVSNQGVQIATLTTDVNALTGEIALKANQTDLTNLSTALTSAELTLDSLQGQITENIQLGHGSPVPRAAGAATLAAIVDQANQSLTFSGALASARQQLQAYTNKPDLCAGGSDPRLDLCRQSGERDDRAAGRHPSHGQFGDRVP